jgi:hypothetical protein
VPDAPVPGWEYPASVALIGVAVGLLVVALLNPDTARHIIWAGALLRLSLTILLCHLMLHWGAKRERALLALGVALVVGLGSLWSAKLYQFEGRLAKPIEVHNYSPLHDRIRQYARELGIPRVFGGDFWRMHTLNATVSDIAAGTLRMDGESNVAPDVWLSRPSLFQPGRPALYFLRTGNKVDDTVRAKLAGAGGRELYVAGDDSIWTGPAVWAAPIEAFEWQGCKLSSQIGRATAACHMEKKDPAASGYLTFGPYVTLAPGMYTFELDVASPAHKGELVGEWDVVTSLKSLTVLQQGRIIGSQGKTQRIEGNFTIARTEDAGRVEVRTSAYPGSALRVERLRIVRYGQGPN